MGWGLSWVVYLPVREFHVCVACVWLYIVVMCTDTDIEFILGVLDPCLALLFLPLVFSSSFHFVFRFLLLSLTLVLFLSFSPFLSSIVLLSLVIFHDLFVVCLVCRARSLNRSFGMLYQTVSKTNFPNHIPEFAVLCAPYICDVYSSLVVFNFCNSVHTNVLHAWVCMYPNNHSLGGFVSVRRHWLFRFIQMKFVHCSL